MRRRPVARSGVRLFLFLLAAMGVPSLAARPVLAQAAWIAPKGEASFSLGYGNAFMKKHYFGSVETDIGHSRSNSLLFGLEYSITDRLAADVGLGYGYNKYYGNSPHAGSELDNGAYHGSFADYAINIRYQVLKEPFVLTPFVGAIIPSHDYVFRAHSAVGKDLHEYPVGFHLARRLDPLLPDAFVHASYSYSFVERVLGIFHDKSTVNLDLGYFVSSSLGVRVAGTYGQSHGGLNIPDDLTTPELRQHHDQLSKDSFVNVGLGLTLALTGAVDVYGGYSRTVWGRNGHKVEPALSFGFAWNFSPQQLVRRTFVGKPRRGREVQ